MFTVCCLLVNWFEQVSWKMERWTLKDGRGKMKNERWNIRKNGRWKREHAGLKMEHESGTNEARVTDEGWRMQDAGMIWLLGPLSVKYAKYMDYYVLLYVFLIYHFDRWLPMINIIFWGSCLHYCPDIYYHGTWTLEPSIYIYIHVSFAMMRHVTCAT